MRIITFKVYEDLLETIDYLAAKKGWSRSEFIRRALEEYVRILVNTSSKPKFVKLDS